MQRIAFATCAALPELEMGDAQVAAVVHLLGVSVESAVWSDPAVDWRAFDAVVIRSCWDYDEHFAAFVAWLDRLDALGIGVLNPTDVVRWNLRKTYLRELSAGGVPIVPTRFVGVGEKWCLAEILAEEGWDQAVVKPVVSLSAHRTWRCSGKSAAAVQHEFEATGSDTGVMVQPFMEQVATDGEWSFVFFAGHYSHTTKKLPAPGDFRVQSEFGGQRLRVHPSSDLIDQAHRVVKALPMACLYARVDGLRVDGVVHLMELELIDPELYVDGDPELCTRFAHAIVKLGGDRSRR